MTFTPQEELPYKCDCCKKKVIFATKTTCEKGDICHECRTHAYEAAGYNKPTLKQTILAQSFRKQERHQMTDGRRFEYMNQEAIERNINKNSLSSLEIEE